MGRSGRHKPLKTASRPSVTFEDLSAEDQVRALMLGAVRMEQHRAGLVAADLRPLNRAEIARTVRRVAVPSDRPVLLRLFAARLRRLIDGSDG